MADQKFKASLSRSQGRGGWCVIFKHPLRTGKDGKPGLRVRRGLGTNDKDSAQILVDQLNQLLGEPDLWNPTERHRAERLFNSKITSAFYEKISPDLRDPWAVRNQVIAIPRKDDGYATVFLVGTTGAGKTTLLRQLIGTDPKTERFPSTSAAKTTISNMEIITESNGIFKAVVSFFDKTYIRQHIEECCLAAIIAHVETKDISEVENRFLVHNEQRFRLSYILGSSKSLASAMDDEITDDEDLADSEDSEQEIPEQERLNLLKNLKGYLGRIRSIADDSFAKIGERLDVEIMDASKEELDAIQELLEEEIYNEDDFQELVDEVLDEVEMRFGFISSGSLYRDSGLWPSHWIFETADRPEFIRTINRFSSNYAPNFGHLLTPLVEGIRVSGPFLPTWYDGNDLKLVLMDGEGLGHTPESASSISTSITKRYHSSDAIVLVDNSAQPMQPTPTAVLQTLVSSGHHSKLIICFTHFDEVKGDNLRNVPMRKEHVLNSFDNSVSAVGKILGPRSEKVLRACKQDRIFFLSKTQNTFAPDGKSLTYTEFIKLLTAIRRTIEPPIPTEAIPMYDDSTLVLNLQRAAYEFHGPWDARLNLKSDPELKPEHWARIKALTRRLGELNKVEYDTLRPVADLLTRLQIHLYLFIGTPIRWKPNDAPDEMKQASLDNIIKELDVRLHEFASERLFISQIKNWHDAYSHRGTGSTRLRAQDVKDIYEDVAPIPGEIQNAKSVEFIQEIRKLLREAVVSGGGTFGVE